MGRPANPANRQNAIKAHRLRQQGLSFNEIAAELGENRGRVQYYIGQHDENGNRNRNPYVRQAKHPFGNYPTRLFRQKVRYLYDHYGLTHEIIAHLLGKRRQAVAMALDIVPEGNDWKPDPTEEKRWEDEVGGSQFRNRKYRTSTKNTQANLARYLWDKYEITEQHLAIVLDVCPETIKNYKKFVKAGQAKKPDKELLANTIALLEQVVEEDG